MPYSTDFRDRDFILTPEVFFFCVVGNIHPKDRVIAYIKYIQDDTGRWGRTRRFRRILESYTTPSVKRTLQVIEEKNHEYLFKSDILSLAMSAVPLERIQKHFRPEEKLRNLLNERNEIDPLEEKAIKLVKEISAESGVPSRFFGITGSILLGIHNPEFSDLDLTVYGTENTFYIKEAMQSLYKQGGLRRFKGKYLDEWAERKATQFPHYPEEAKKLYKRMWNRGFFNGTLFSIHPVKLNKEVKEVYGDRIYIPKDIVTIRARITDTDEAFFLPARYGLDNVTVANRVQSGITDVTSYNGFYCDLFKKGEYIEARGKLEEVRDLRRNLIHKRLLVGSFEAGGTDYMKPLI